MRNAIALDQLRGYAVTRTLFEPTTLPRAIARLGFVQADPICAPACAQDLTLRHRVHGYRAGDLERRYPQLAIEEGFFINYGFIPRAHYLLMHPRGGWHEAGDWDAATRRRARAILAFIRERGTAHPREVDAHFDHGTVTNYWGGSSNATTHLLQSMHYRGLVRVVRRDRGVRVYAAQPELPAVRSVADTHGRVDALIHVVIRKYAPMPGPSFSGAVARVAYGAPHLAKEIRPALARAKQRLAHVRVEGVEWYWPADEDPLLARHDDSVRLLTPFDPLVWDRRRFELFWDWPYRFEAYTPKAKRTRGYYALPLLWRDRIIGWANASRQGANLVSDVGFVKSRPRDRVFGRELDAELDRMRRFLKLGA